MDNAIVPQVFRLTQKNSSPSIRALPGAQQKKQSKLTALLWALRDSNPRPPRCKRGALNQLS